MLHYATIRYDILQYATHMLLYLNIARSLLISHTNETNQNRLLHVQAIGEKMAKWGVCACECKEVTVCMIDWKVWMYVGGDRVWQKWMKRRPCCENLKNLKQIQTNQFSKNNNCISKNMMIQAGLFCIQKVLTGPWKDSNIL